MNETTSGGGGVIATIEESPRSIFAGAPVTPSGDRAVVMTLASVSAAIEVQLQYTPMEMDVNGLAMEHATIPRPGRRAIVTPTAEALPEVSFEALFGYEDGETSVQGALEALTALANDGNPITMSIGSTVMGDLWRMTGLTFSIRARNSTGAVTLATAQVTLTASDDIDITLTPTSSAILAQPVPPPTTDPTVVQQASDAGTAAGQKLMALWKTWWEAADDQGIRDTTDPDEQVNLWRLFMEWLWDPSKRGKLP